VQAVETRLSHAASDSEFEQQGPYCPRKTPKSTETPAAQLHEGPQGSNEACGLRITQAPSAAGGGPPPTRHMVLTHDSGRRESAAAQPWSTCAAFAVPPHVGVRPAPTPPCEALRVCHCRAALRRCRARQPRLIHLRFGHRPRPRITQKKGAKARSVVLGSALQLHACQARVGETQQCSEAGTTGRRWQPDRVASATGMSHGTSVWLPQAHGSCGRGQ
jgi:hypothetical protein